MNQAELIACLCDRPQNFAWFLGAGASRAAGLPTATDVIWDLKWRHYCREENQNIDRQDLQNDTVKQCIQSYFDAHGFPALWDDDEYTTYFERIFGCDRERQRSYISAQLAEKRISLSIGNRVFGALIAAGLTRVVFTTNFDTIVEKAVAEMGHQSLPVYHLEGAHAANSAFNNEDFPMYCKLHGDFRYDSLKNIAQDLEHQNEDLSFCLINAANRFGFVVSGYSGRDKSIMQLFEHALKSHNPFPHGLYWTVMKGSAVSPAVHRIVDAARSRGVTAAVIQIPTFDSFMLHIWRNIKNKPGALDAKVHKSHLATVDIPMPSIGRGGPLLRLTGLPILRMPELCQSLTFTSPKDWNELRWIMFDSKGGLILTKGDVVLAWGNRHLLHESFGRDLSDIAETSVPTDLHEPKNYHVKGFLERALALSLTRRGPLLTREHRSAFYLIANSRATSSPDLAPLSSIVGDTNGVVRGLFTSPTPEHPEREEVRWAEALRISISQADGRFWMLVHPDIWIWPPRTRRDAQDFMQRRRSSRFNAKYNDLLDAWLHVVLGKHPPSSSISLSAFNDGSDKENPQFVLNTRTALAWRNSK